MSVLSQTVMRVLGSPSAQKIDFRIGSIHVNGFGLARIANLIAVGTISTKVVALDANTAAQYVPATNSLEFPRENFGANAQERCDILHECIHALHDIYGAGSPYPQQGGSSFTPRSENEAAAFVGDALFYLYETGGGAQSGGHILDIAAVIAKRIANQRGGLVTVDEAKALRVAIVLHPIHYNYGYHAPTIANGP